jgi:hypothetical protein
MCTVSPARCSSTSIETDSSANPDGRLRVHRRVVGPGDGECEPLYMAMENTGFCCSWRGVGSPSIACSNSAWEAVLLCDPIDIVSFDRPGDLIRILLVGTSGNRVSSRSPVVLWDMAAKSRFLVRGFADVTSCDLASMADLDGDFGGEVEGRVEGASEEFIFCS